MPCVKELDLKSNSPILMHKNRALSDEIVDKDEELFCQKERGHILRLEGVPVVNLDSSIILEKMDHDGLCLLEESNYLGGAHV